MPQFSTRRRVRHSAADMFDLVADVERYPEFVPLCRDLTVRRRTTEDEGVEVVVADMTVAYKLVRETFRSKVTLDRPNLQILVEYLEGPFSHMQNRWTLRAAGDDACEVEFFIDYEFRSRTLGLLMGAMFDAAFRRFAVAFERRADAGLRAQERLTRSARRAGKLAQHRERLQAPNAAVLRRGRCRRTALVMEQAAVARGSREMHQADRLARPCRRPARRCR